MKRFNWNKMPAANKPANVERQRPDRVVLDGPVAQKLPLTITGPMFATAFCGTTGRPLFRTVKA